MLQDALAPVTAEIEAPGVEFLPIAAEVALPEGVQQLLDQPSR